ncbi:MAG: type II toxin-antitoxin system VapC family toxin [Planctomycetota bacterium]
MNAYLLDTHILLWWLDDPRKLSAAAREAIAGSSNAVYVSAAAAWEIGIKKGIGRLEIPDDLVEVVERSGIRTLPISAKHGLSVAGLPPHHTDPFDRLMVAQAAAEGLVFVTRDKDIQKYDIAVLRG